MLQLVSLLGVEHTKRVKVLRASNLKLDHISAPLDFHRASILPSCSEKEVLNLMDLLRLVTEKTNKMIFNTLCPKLTNKIYRSITQLQRMLWKFLHQLIINELKIE